MTQIDGKRDGSGSTALVVVLVVCIGFAIGLWAGANHGEHTSENRPETADRYAPRLVALDGAPATYEALCISPSTPDQADLCQQWRVAVAAERAAAGSDLQVGISVLSLAALIFTVFYAARAVAVSRATGEAQVRAYLTCTSATFWIREGWITVSLAIKNYGQSPAIRVVVSGILETAPVAYYPVPADDLIRTPQARGITNLLPVGDIEGGTTLMWTDGDGPAEQKDAVTKVIGAILDNGSDFSVRCRLDWEDVFGGKHYQNLLLYYDEDSKAMAPSPLRRDGTIRRVFVVSQDDRVWPGLATV